MTELRLGGKNWLIPPSTIITPTAMLTRRLWICQYGALCMCNMRSTHGGEATYKMLEKSILVVLRVFSFVRMDVQRLGDSSPDR